MKQKIKRIKKSQQGFTQWVILIIMMLGIGVGVWVAQIRTNLVPQASAPQQQVQSSEMSLKVLTSVALGKPFELGIFIRSDIDPVRLATTHLSYDHAALEVVKINTPQIATNSAVIYATASAEPINSPHVSQWLETLFDNKTGKAAVTGLFSTGNLKTDSAKEPVMFVTFTLTPKVLPAEIKIDESSLLLRAADNANILTKRDGLVIVPFQATPSATPN